MRMRDTEVPKHIHQWRIYKPDCDDPQLSMSFEMAGPPDLIWTYRRCDCGSRMRCKTAELASYPHDFRAFADETWIEC